MTLKTWASESPEFKSELCYFQPRGFGQASDLTSVSLFPHLPNRDDGNGRCLLGLGGGFNELENMEQGPVMPTRPHPGSPPVFPPWALIPQLPPLPPQVLHVPE